VLFEFLNRCLRHRSLSGHSKSKVMFCTCCFYLRLEIDKSFKYNNCPIWMLVLIDVKTVAGCMALTLFFFLHAKIHEPTWTPSQGDRRNADVSDDLKCRRCGFTLQLPRQAVSVIVQVVNHDERRNVQFRSREFCILVPRNLIVLLQAWGCTNFILHQWYICGFLVLETCGLCVGNSLMKGGNVVYLVQECHNPKFDIFKLLV
jgi:hypothetical protein